MDTQAIAGNLDQLKRGIIRAAESCGRDPGEIELLAVSKTFPVEAVEAAAATGQRLFGENRVQEAQRKIPQAQSLPLEWHLIGHLQSNKARVAVELFDVIQTLDNLKLARRLDRLAGELHKRPTVYLQVNLALEEQKFGFRSAEAAAAAAEVSSLPHLRLTGLMAIPPYAADPEETRPHFRRLAELRETIRQNLSIPLPGLSMGMTHDYGTAIEEGATLVRVGTAIFGRRAPL